MVVELAAVVGAELTVVGVDVDGGVDGDDEAVGVAGGLDFFVVDGEAVLVVLAGEVVGRATSTVVAGAAGVVTRVVADDVARVVGA